MMHTVHFGVGVGIGFHHTHVFSLVPTIDKNFGTGFDTGDMTHVDQGRFVIELASHKTLTVFFNPAFVLNPAQEFNLFVVSFRTGREGNRRPISLGVTVEEFEFLLKGDLPNHCHISGIRFRWAHH